MRVRTRACVLAAVLGAAFSVSAATPEWRFSGVDRIVAVGDVHGAYEAFVRTLKAAGVIDGQGGWSGGRSHLVVVGDVLDRGADSRKAIDLVRRLEPSAAAAGGAVHLTLGNHELMNLLGDLRYVSAGEYAAFAPEETRKQRDEAFAAYLATRGLTATEEARTGFDRKYAAGFFAHRRAFSLDGEYGAWLSSKPWLVVVNNWAFVHGGLPEQVAEVGGEGVNGRLRDELRDYLENLVPLLEAGVLDPTVSFYEHPQFLEQYRAAVGEGASSWDAETEEAAANVARLNAANLFSAQSVLWYRGSVGCADAIEAPRLDRNLAVLGAGGVVVGHTPTRGSVLERLDGHLVRIDTGMLNAYYGGRGSALIIEGDSISVVYEDGTVDSPRPQRRPGAASGLDLDAAAVESLLSGGEVTARVNLDGGVTRLTLDSGNGTVDALFTKAAGRGRNLPNVAAYRLDRMLGLDMVPISVRRELDGDLGTVQLADVKTVSETERVEKREGGDAWCPLRDQFNAMYLFDALIHNEGRTPEHIRYLPRSWHLVLTGHDNAFGTGKGIPRHLQNVPLVPGPGWTNVMKSWDQATLDAALGDVLDARRIKALLARRDRLLQSHQ